jgi:Lon protease-like protein
MCMYSESTPYHYTEYGCVLEIQSHQFTRDGRAIVATVGGKRFKVLSSTTKDGYSVGQIEWVKDEKVEDEEEKAQLQLLHDEVYRLAHNWYSLIPDAKKDRILEIYGVRDLPEPEQDIQSNDNGPYWFWFLLNILPLETHLQYKFLTKTNLKERLKQMKKIIIILMTPLERLRQMNESTSSSSSSSLSASRNQSITSVSPAISHPEQPEQQPSTYNISPSTTESSINQYVQNVQENLTSSNSSDQQQQTQNNNNNNNTL